MIKLFKNKFFGNNFKIIKPFNRFNINKSLNYNNN